MSSKISVVRFRHSSDQPWEFYKEGLSIAGAQEFARIVERNGGEAIAFTIELSDAELTELIERKANEVTL